MRITDEEERARLLLRQGAAQAARGRTAPGRFLPAEWQGMAVHEAREAGVEVAFDGGHPDAERVQVCFCPPGETPRFTARWLEIRWNARFASPDHRDLLGSLMGLGMDRAYMGDLVSGEGRAWLYALDQAAERLPMEWTQAGHASIAVTVLDSPPELPVTHGAPVRVTVPSLRLDAVLAAVLKLSRAAAAERIRSGEVSVDHRQELRPDHPVGEGTLLSLRGTGRVKIREIGEATRKDRLPVTAELFISSRSRS